MSIHLSQKEDNPAPPGSVNNNAELRAPFAACYGDSPRDKLMAAACKLICRDGITATGIDKIVEQAGTAKTTLYKIFGSKDGLVEAVLEAEGRAWRDWFIAELHEHKGKPKTKLAAIFKILEIWFKSESFYGCPFINAVGESCKNDDRMRAIALNHKRSVLAVIEELACKAGARNASRLTHELALLIDGAIITAMITHDPGAARTAQRAAKIIIDHETDTKQALTPV